MAESHTDKSQPITIDYYSDILCVWAWIAQKRIDELVENYGQQIQFNYYNVNIFGDVFSKINLNWQDRDGFYGFAKHVVDSASIYDHAVINEDVWTKTRPSTSANAHLVIKALEVTHNSSACVNFAYTIREAFYCHALDISSMAVLLKLVQEQGFDQQAVQNAINNGTAMAALMNDYQRAYEFKIKGSPSYVMDGGRQVLFGNVGYRVLSANLQELIRRPSNEASWC